MKAKTINAILHKKFNDFLKSIDDEQVRNMVEKNTIITGGCITSMLLKEPVNDYDIYFRNFETAKAVAEYYVARFEKSATRSCEVIIAPDLEGKDRVKIKMSGNAGISQEVSPELDEAMQDPGAIEDGYERAECEALKTVDDGKGKYRPVFMSTNAITLSNQIQIILRFYGEPESIHENYDFVHCTNYWASWEQGAACLVLRQKALEAILAKELVYVGSKYPICSLFRLRKFIRRGWQINAGQVLKMAMQVSELDLKSVAVLEDQLTGVDVAYFISVIEQVKAKDPEKVNSAYLVEIINRMF